jgi:hypothetical protein
VDVRAGGAQSLDVVTRRAVVDDDDLETIRFHLELAQALDARKGVIGTVVVHDDDGHQPSVSEPHHHTEGYRAPSFEDMFVVSQRVSSAT